MEKVNDLISRSALLAKAEWEESYMDTDGFRYVRLTDVLDAPAVEAEPVLRCEKCRYYFSLDDGDICRRPGLNGEIVEMPVTPDGYCAWGESRDGSI